MRGSRGFFLLTMFLLLALLSPLPVKADSNLEIQSIKVTQTQVEGSRGAALAVGSDGTLYLGGGEKGATLFRFFDGTLEPIGRISTQRERLRDLRFGPTDVAILGEDASGIDFLISYPQLGPSRNCVRLVVYRYRYESTSTTPFRKKERWFQGTPCVPVGAVQHAAGRIEVIDQDSAYLTTGDLGFRSIDDRKKRGTLGGVFKISRTKVEQLSQGHRNPQGILLIGKNLYISEHGPRGGDEINLIEPGKDYGWPDVTYGAPYGPGDYIKPGISGSHEGFTKPLITWVPSVAPTELVQIPSDRQWGDMKDQVVMGTLIEESLIFLELTSKRRIKEVRREYIGERIRDLEIGTDGALVASTDSGKLLFITRKG